MKLKSVESKHLILRPLRETDIQYVHAWRSELSDLHLWFYGSEILSLAEFSSKLNEFIKHSVHVFMIIELPNQSNHPIGMIYSYKADYLNGFAYLCLFIDRTHRNLFYGAEAGLLFLDYMFDYFPFRKIYSEVYGHNATSLRNLQKGGWEQEGKLLKHIWKSGEYRDLIVFALYRESFSSRYTRLLSRIKQSTENRAQHRLVGPEKVSPA